MAGKKRLLFFTNSDYGQSNVVLATTHALALTCQDAEIHVASFHDLQDGVENASRFMQATAAKQKQPILDPFIFHKMEGNSWGPAVKSPETAVFDTLELAPNFVNSAKGVAVLPAVMIPWGPREFLAIYKDAQRALEEVDPDLTIVESLFAVALTLCHYLGIKWMVLSPNTIKEYVLPLQPKLAGLWKYPKQVTSPCSALPYPIPWSLMPTNIGLNLVAAYTLITDTRLKKTAEILRREIDPSISLMTMMELGVFKPIPPNLPILVANSPDIDYPFSFIPPELTSCGPIIRPSPHIEEVDAALAAWLTRAPTIFVNLGTHHKSNPTEALEMAKALRRVLERADNELTARGPLQLLWKLGRTADQDGNAPKRDTYTGEWALVIDTLRTYIDHDRARVTDWLVAEPKSVLESQSILCSVNHGGANSFHEGLCSGVPQALLPAWTDCYDFANRAELLGIGRWANKMAKPRWTEDELTDALVDILFGPNSEHILKAAKELASRHPEWEGRQRAAQEILKYLDK
ncbi:UDP-glycosyltransferase 84B2 [Fusarium austroafricanum]|uniref:UDP-glycosyltransferase 84B2 n=1 Tax=Fusarium austroafricanum TaxID=2364996 RepID=A0A8H4JV17_9HYPO|nr:UDP-glycosyltransferase 84B2 [Fusarium austroafricanum]